MAKVKNKKPPCTHGESLIQKMHCVICAKCKFIVYYGYPRKEDVKRLVQN